MPSNHLIPCRPLLLPPIFPSIKVFFSESALCIRWLMYWSFSFSISPSNEYSGLISFRIDWFGLLPVQGTLKRLFQHHNLKASVLWYSAFFMVQLSHLYMTTGKTIALTIWTFVGKVISLLQRSKLRLGEVESSSKSHSKCQNQDSDPGLSDSSAKDSFSTKLEPSDFPLSKNHPWDFPGGPCLRICLPMQGTRV